MSTCARCGAEFFCGMADRKTADAAPCWCTRLPPFATMPPAGQAGCWCPACLDAVLAQAQAGKPD